MARIRRLSCQGICRRAAIPGLLGSESKLCSVLDIYVTTEPTIGTGFKRSRVVTNNRERFTLLRTERITTPPGLRTRYSSRSVLWSEGKYSMTPAAMIKSNDAFGKQRSSISAIIKSTRRSGNRCATSDRLA